MGKVIDMIPKIEQKKKDMGFVDFEPLRTSSNCNDGVFVPEDSLEAPKQEEKGFEGFIILAEKMGIKFILDKILKEEKDES